MSKFFFVDRVKTIWEVAKVKDVAVDFAYDRFIADVRNGYDANCGLENYDFAAEKALWDAIPEADQDIARNTYKKFVSEKYTAICEAWSADDFEAIDAIIAEFKAECEAKENEAAEEAEAETTEAE